MELGSNFYHMGYEKEVDDNIFHYLDGYNTRYYDSGRSCIRELLKVLGNEKIALPDYICDSVTEIFPVKQRLWYRINRDMTVNVEDIISCVKHGARIVYLMHYFGKLQSKRVLDAIKNLKEDYGIVVIEDSTHSIFTRRMTVGDYCLCSLRKWFPIPDGAVLYSKSSFDLPECVKQKDVSMVMRAMELKRQFLFEGKDTNAEYRSLFTEAETNLDRQKDVFGMSLESRDILRCISIFKMMEARKKNTKLIQKAVEELSWIRPVLNNDSNSLEVGEDDVEIFLAYPVYMDKRDEVRAFLMKHRIYCAIHWPEGKQEIQNSIISLPIDQRYGEKEMEYLIEVLRKY